MTKKSYRITVISGPLEMSSGDNNRGDANIDGVHIDVALEAIGKSAK